MRREICIVFGRDGNAAEYCRGGWSSAEPEQTWSVDGMSELVVPSFAIERRSLLLISGWPHTRPNLLRRQRIAVNINGHDVAVLIMRKRQTLAVVVPRHVSKNRTDLVIRLTHPDGARPADFVAGNLDRRCLAVAYQELTIQELAKDVAKLALEIRAVLKKSASERHFFSAPEVSDAQARAEAVAILAKFQSLGDDCEFGIVQSELGLQPLGLLRFSTTAIADVTRGISNGFSGIADENQFELVEYTDRPDHDYMGRERTYGMYYHTYRYPKQIGADVLKAQEIVRLKFLARKFMEDLELGDQILVVKRKRRPIAEEIASLLAAIRTRGPSRLLWVCEAGEFEPPGSVERVAHDLVVGYVDRIDLSPLDNVSFASWVAVCRSAHSLWDAEQGSAFF